MSSEQKVGYRCGHEVEVEEVKWVEGNKGAFKLESEGNTPVKYLEGDCKMCSKIQEEMLSPSPTSKKHPDMGHHAHEMKKAP